MNHTDTQPLSSSRRQTGARAPRTVRPKFHVEGQIPTKKLTLEIKVTAAEALEAYAAYVGNQSGYTVTPSAIVERLVAELERDKVFKAHRQEATRTGRAIGATAKEVGA